VATSKTAKAVAGQSLLIELLTEELPPKSLARLSVAFADAVTDSLRAGAFIGAGDAPEKFATPRRLAVLIPNVRARQRDGVVERKGPSVQAGLDASGRPTPALVGFSRSCGVDPSKLERRKDKKGEYFLYRLKKKGEPLAAHLAGYVEQAVKRLPVAKLMRWSSRDIQFVRPVHGLVMLHGSKVVPGEVLGLKSGNKTRGHRFMSRGPITIKRAVDYAKTLRVQGKVVAGYDTRQEQIVRGLDAAAAKLGAGTAWRLGQEMELVEEVTSIVESPSVHIGAFDPAFLEVPRECLISSMQHHLKHFALADARGRLQPRFLFVANTQPRDPSQIVHGNERVLRARLADAKFFYDQDRKTRLAERVPRLAHVVYHSKLGSQLERVERIQVLAAAIALMLKADPVAAERAAYLSKADLLTDMVGEFPELQGVMGRYYARHDGEAADVADAIEQHYLPRAAGAELPRGAIATSVALADKLDALVGIFGIGLAPSGEKDPFGMRRAAVGVLRILIEEALSLDLGELLEQARRRFEGVALAAGVTGELRDFFHDRLRPYLRERGYAPDEIEAVLALAPSRLDQLIPRLDALRKFRAAPEGQALAAANKRIQNILRQATDGDPDQIAPAIDGTLFREEAEKRLAAELSAVAKRVRPLTAAGDFAAALKELSHLRATIDTFFDKVMVMVEDENLRTARLQLLAQIRSEFRAIADVSKLQG
jgi:glycyl-tRNA synthetase beta chain